MVAESFRRRVEIKVGTTEMKGVAEIRGGYIKIVEISEKSGLRYTRSDQRPVTKRLMTMVKPFLVRNVRKYRRKRDILMEGNNYIKGLF